MKKVSFIAVILGLAAIVSCGTASKATLSAADAANAEVVTTMLDNRVYKMDFDRAYPTAGPSFTLNYPYYVSIIRDRVESFLPYFGRAYNVAYNGGEGLHFDAPIEDYKTTKGRKGQLEVTFQARTTEDNYRFRIEVYPNGETRLSVSAMRKQSMSFSGHMDLDAEFEVIRVTE
jgi:hypothetical protein